MSEQQTEMKIESFIPDQDQIDGLIEEALNNGFREAKGRLPKSAEERVCWMRDENGAQVLNGVAPVGFAVQPLAETDLSDPETYLTSVVEIMPVVNPLFHALMVKLGATPNGPRSYEISAGKGKSSADLKNNTKRLAAILEVLPGSVCYTPSCVEQGEKQGFRSYNISRFGVFRDLYCLISDTPAGESIEKSRVSSVSEAHPDQGALAGAAIIINSAKGRIFVKVCTNRNSDKALLLSDEAGSPDLDRLRASGRLDPQLVTPDRAVQLMEAAEMEGYPVIDPSGSLTEMRSKLSEMVVAQRVAGSPGQGRLVVGSAVTAKLGSAEKRLPSEGAVRVAVVSAKSAGEAVRKAAQGGAKAALAPEVADVIAMAAAQPVAKDDPDSELTLREYQREAVGLHLATKIGYLQACSVGLGKTAITLRAMRQTAAAKAS